jgi:hypothetical protein
MIAGIYISRPHGAQRYVAERPLKGSLKLLWSAVPTVVNGRLFSLVRARLEAPLLASEHFFRDNRREILEAVSAMRISASSVPKRVRRQAYRRLAHS